MVFNVHEHFLGVFMAKKGSSNVRTRNWTTILYPGDLLEDFLDRLDSLHVEYALSPLHEPDGEHDKPHYHLALFFDGPKSFKQVFDLLYEIFEGPFGWIAPKAINAAKAMLRYFIHLDQPEKQQFVRGWQEIYCGNGLDISNYLVPTSSEKQQYIYDMQSFVDKNNILYVSDLFDYARQHRYDTWFYVLSNSCLAVMRYYIDARRNKLKTFSEAKLKMMVRSDFQDEK